MNGGSPGSPPAEWRRQQINEYAAEYRIYCAYAEALRRVFERLCERVAPLAIVQARAKSVASFAGKAVRRWPRRHDPVRQFTDLCGARVITTTEAEAAHVRAFIERRFHIVESDDASRRLGAAEFGYGSFHYVVQPTPAAFGGVELPAVAGRPAVGEHPAVVELPAGQDVDAFLKRLGQRRAEIQVRTLMQHAWADVMHDRLYKSRIRVPEAWRHAAARQAALLEQADREFSGMVAELDSKLAHHDAYMTAEELDREIAALSAVLESELAVRGSESQDRQKEPPASEIARLAPLVLQIARLCRQRGAWTGVIEVLDPWAQGAAVLESDTGRAMLVELGRALCMAHPVGHAEHAREHARGRQLLEEVGQPDTIDIDSVGALGLRPDPIRAAAVAHLAALGEQGEGKISSRTRDLYQKAMALDPGNPYRVIRGLWVEVLWRHDLATLRPLVPRIHEAARACQEHADLGIEVPRAYFDLARCHLFLQQYYESLAAYAKAVEKSDAEGITAELSAVEGLREVLEREQLELDWIARFLRLAHARKLRTDAAPPLTSAEPVNPPVVVVAGGTDPVVEEFVGAYRERLQTAFKGFTGTIVSGGTRAGVAGLVGEIAEREPGVTAMAYLPPPQKLPRDAPEDRRYRIHQSRGESFCPLQPLEVWEHLFASGIRPSDVRVLGINGGRLAAFEYRLALALGATVGLVEGSGRAVNELLPDGDFWPPGRLLRLPDDVMTLRAFINPGQSALAGGALEAAAQVAHEVYVRQQLAASQQPWGALRAEFQDSTRQQVLYAAQILAQHGYRVEALVPGHVDPVFSAEEVESMAEMEHGRWNVERLKAGWRLGEPKSVERQISPFLVPWGQVPEEIKKYDREAVRGYPGILRPAGLGIRRDPSVIAPP